MFCLPGSYKRIRCLQVFFSRWGVFIWSYQSNNLCIQAQLEPSLSKTIWVPAKFRRTGDIYVSEMCSYTIYMINLILCFRFDALTELGAFMRTEYLCISVLSGIGTQSEVG